MTCIISRMTWQLTIWIINTYARRYIYKGMNSEYVDKTLEILLSIESLYYHDQWSVKSYNISLSNIKQ